MDALLPQRSWRAGLGVASEQLRSVVWVSASDGKVV